MRVWIDLSNSPHPLLFGPIVRELEKDGHELVITARDNAQTRELTIERWPEAEIIGGPSPAPRLQKGGAIAHRVSALRRWAKTVGPDLALSHNSYAQILAARSLGIETVTAMDYEHQPINHLAFRLASRIVLPEAFPAEMARRQGARPGRTVRYRGFKEEIYLGDFEPREKMREEAGLAEGDDRALVVVRTPPTGATYHRFDNPGFERLLAGLDEDRGCVCVLLCRSAGQRQALRDRLGPSFVVPTRALDSRSLIYLADLFVGAGGTMTREAALMGVPTVSVYAGRRAAIDVELERRGALRMGEPDGEIAPVSHRAASPRTQAELRERADTVISEFLSAALG